MKKIKSRRFNASRYSAVLAAAAVTVPALVAPVIANAADADEVVKSGHRHADVIVHGERKKHEVSSVKKTETILNTPQTITVIDSKIMQEQGATSLMDALQNTPGITMQMGENGNTSSGDTFKMRGFSAQTSIYLDGIRDLGAVSRDVFNIEQIEVAKGSAGSEGGRGSSAGYVNLVSKRAHRGLDNAVEVTGYSQSGSRGSIDLNHDIGETASVRLNVFAQDVDVAGRDYVNKSGYGIAPSFTVGQGTPTRFSIFGQYVKNENVPDGGIPTIGYDGYYNTNAAIMGGSKVRTKNYYGGANDYEDTEAYMGTILVEHDFANGSRLTNTTRYGKTSMMRDMVGIYAVAAPSADPSTWTLSRLRQGVDQDNTIYANQTNFVTNFKTNVLVHDLVLGAEVLYEEQDSNTLATSYYPAPGAAQVSSAAINANLYNPNPEDDMGHLYYTGATSNGKTTTLGLYAFDTIKYGENWLFNVGVRTDTYETKSNSVVVNAAGRGTSADPTLPIGALIPHSIKDSDTVVSWNIGAVYKPRENGSVYLAYSTAQTPPGSANFSLSTSANSTSNPDMDPQETENLELGTKWELFRKHLILSGALYKTTHKNELTMLDSDTNTYGQMGERTVQGIELSAIGNITPRWSVIAGYQSMDTDVKKGTSGSNADGAAAQWSPENSASFWTTYKFTRRLMAGVGAVYMGEQKRTVDPSSDLAKQVMPNIPSYTVVNAMVNFNVTPKTFVRLNVNNLLDEDYITSLNNAGVRIIVGAPRNGSLTIGHKF